MAILNGAAPAFAQAADQATASTGSGLEEIVVTARRREERLQTVPIAVTAFTGAQLAEQQVTDGADLQRSIPSLNFNTDVFRLGGQFALRGQGVATGGGPGVVAYLAEAPLPYNPNNGSSGVTPGFYFDLDTVQVLEGPQGTLFGKNTTGGAILFEPKKPTDSFEGYVQQTFGNYDDFVTEAALNVPIIPDKVLFRIAGSRGQRDGYTTDVGPVNYGRDYDGQDYWSGRAELTLRPIDDLQNDAMVNVQYARNNGDGYQLVDVNPAVAPYLLPYLAAQQGYGVRHVAYSDPVTVEKVYSLMISDTFTWDITPDLRLRNIVAYQELKQTLNNDQDGTALALLDDVGPGPQALIGSYTEEPQLQGKSLDEKLTWVVGGYLEFDHPIGHEISDFLLPYPLDETLSQSQRSQAAYAQGTYDLSGLSDLLTGFKLTAGYRYTWDTVTVANDEFLPTFHLCAQGGVYPNCVAAGSADFHAGTYTFSLDYQVDENTLAYAATRAGYKAGGFNPGAPVGFQKFDPETLTDVEIGLKSEWQLYGIKGRTNIAAFRSDYNQIQITVPLVVNGIPSEATENAGAATIEGVELQGTIIPVKGVELTGYYSYNDAYYTRYGASAADAPTFPFYERNKYSLTGRYHLPVPDNIGDVSLALTYSYQSSWKGPSANLPLDWVHGYGLLDIHLDWNGIAGQPLDASVFVKNATDQIYKTGIFDVYTALGYATASYGPPQMFGVQFRYQFGS
jgi:iron complex outermembrane receptor protein